MCSPETSFLAQDFFYSNALHALSAIEVPIHLFGAYIIMAKTPQKMTSVKQSMIVLHSVGAFYDFYLSFISMPVFTLPFCAGYPLGLTVLLGIRTDVQVYLGFCFMSCVCTAILSFFEDRYHVLRNGPTQRRNWKRKSYILFHYVLSFLFLAPAFMSIPDQTFGKLMILQKEPCFSSELFSRPGFFILTLDGTVCLICLITMIFLLTSQLFFFAIMITWKLSHATSKSKVTNKLQKQFMVALGLQVIIPLTVFGFPAAYVTSSMWNNYFNQAGTNLAFIVLNCHGIASTITMLTVHRPYRDAALRILHIQRHRADTNHGSKMWKTGAGAIGSSI